MSGHLHQARSAVVGAATQVWAPSTWAVLPETSQPSLGDQRCGLLSLVLADDGSFIPAFAEPAGLCQQTVDARLLEPPTGLRVV